MAKGQTANIRRKNRKNEDNEKVMQMFGDNIEGTGEHDFGPSDDLPLPPGIATTKAADEDDDSSEEEAPKKASKKETKKIVKQQGGVGGGRIKTTPLILLIIMLGTTLIPAFIYAGDFLSAFLAKNHLLGQMGFRLGIGAVPRKRVTSFYEKHAPEKISDVPSILAKHYGDYPKLIKKLERKYQDYGYFLGWEEDEAPIRLALEHVQETYSVWVQQYWNRYAPQFLKTAARNVRYNLTFLYKKLYRIWKRHVWPLLQPVLDFNPDRSAAAKQKRADAAEARKRKTGTSSSGSARRKNRDFRDEDEM